MPPKLDPSEKAVIMMRTVGGEPPAMSALAPKLGPLGMSPKKVGDDIQKGTKDFKGLKVMVKLTIQNRQSTVEVIPSASALIIAGLKEPPRDKKKEKNILHNGNLTLAQVYDITRVMRPRSLAKKFSGTVTEILGTCQSIGCTVDNKSPHDLILAIKAGELTTPEK